MPDVVATVGGQPIPRTDFELRYEPLAKMVLARRDDGILPNAFQAKHRVKFIEELTWAKQLELATGGDYEREKLAKLESDERRHVSDWEAWLARINQTPEIRRDNNLVYLRERALFAARGMSIKASEDELRAQYEANKDKMTAPQEVVRASHLLITYGPRTGEEKIQPLTAAARDAATPEQLEQWKQAARARAEALRAKSLEPGVDFNELAKEYSEGPGAFRGGDMGLFPFRQMVPAYAEAAFALQAGETSALVEDDKGFYVIRSFGKFPAGELLPFEAVRPDIERQLEQQKYGAAKQALKTELDESYPVVSEILDEARNYKGR